MPVDTINQDPSGHEVSLRDYIDARIVAEDTLSERRHLASIHKAEAEHELALAEIKRIDQLYLSKFAAYDSAIALMRDSIEKQFLGVKEAQLLFKDNIVQQFASVSKGTDTATDALDKRLEGMNEFRQQMNDMASRFITRSDVESAQKYMTDRVGATELSISNCISRQELASQQSAISERVSGLEKFSNNMQGRMWVIAAVVVVMEIALRFLAMK